MKKIQLLVTFLILSNGLLFAQTFSGQILNGKTKQPIEYVNIGIIGKNIGTVSDNSGKYSITFDSQSDNDTLMISCIGYYPYTIKISEFKTLQNHDINLKERVFEIAAVEIHPIKTKLKTLGVTAKSRSIQAGFKENQLGYECGVLMKLKKSAHLERININFSTCSYDTIFYRVNIYKVNGEMNFENILQTPIYIKLPKEETRKTVYVDLEPYNINVQGNFLVTLEHVRDLGPGYLYFCSSLRSKSYYRKTSQGKWETVPVGVGISVDAKVEL